MQTSITSRSLPTTVTGVSGDVNSPYMKQFVHSKSQQYRRLKTEWRNNVYLARSRIQVCYLICLKLEYLFFFLLEVLLSLEFFVIIGPWSFFCTRFGQTYNGN